MNREVLVLLLIFIFSIFIAFNLRTAEVPEMKTVKKMEGEIRIGVLSDTHIPDRASKIPDQLIQRFNDSNVDVIVHAGDMSTLAVKEELESIAPVFVVCGNMDADEVCEEFPKRAVLEVNDLRIGVLHNTVNPLSNKMVMLARENKLDMLIFGHTHRNSLEEKDGVYYMNPGSPTQPILDKASFGMVNITGNEIAPKIINIED